MLRVVSLPGDPGVGSRLASFLGLELVSTLYKRFPDGETYLRLTKRLEGEEVLLVQSMYPAQNDRFMELLLALEALERYGNSVHLLITYLAYARQDKEFLPNESISLRSVIKSITSLGIKTLITIDAHNPKAVKEFLGEVRYINLLPTKVFAEAISSKYGERGLVVVAPDQGAEERAADLAKNLGCEYVVVKKTRDKVTGEVSHVLDTLGSIHNTSVVIDDIISTGGTIAGIASYLSSRGVGVIVAASHALLVGDAYERLMRSGIKEVYSLPTVGHTVSGVIYLDVVPYIINRLKEEGVVD